MPIDRLRAALDEIGLSQAVLSHPATLASLGCFETPVEDRPVSNPFVAVPALLCLDPADAVLIVADFHAPDGGQGPRRTGSERGRAGRPGRRRRVPGSRSARGGRTRAR